MIKETFCLDDLVLALYSEQLMKKPLFEAQELILGQRIAY